MLWKARPLLLKLRGLLQAKRTLPSPNLLRTRKCRVLLLWLLAFLIISSISMLFYDQKIECDGGSVVNAQLQGCCLVVSAAVPCNNEVPLAVNILGCNLYPKCGCCVTVGDIQAQSMFR